MGDFNEVRHKCERLGSVFNASEANVFNSFIVGSGLAEVVLGGNKFTCCHKFGSKMRKLDSQFTSSNTISRQVEETLVEEVDTSSTLGRRHGVLAGGSCHPGPTDETAPRHRTSRCPFLRRRVAYLPVYHRCPPSRPEGSCDMVCDGVRRFPC
nr:RNA-directed DNA polymerase, eukaryota, reverse transcriptase zinc-binding domain protein [Tanacetum cinerariifolium]